jgi:hypothetical protein
LFFCLTPCHSRVGSWLARVGPVSNSCVPRAKPPATVRLLHPSHNVVISVRTEFSTEHPLIQRPRDHYGVRGITIRRHAGSTRDIYYLEVLRRCHGTHLWLPRVSSTMTLGRVAGHHAKVAKYSIHTPSCVCNKTSHKHLLRVSWYQCPRSQPPLYLVPCAAPATWINCPLRSTI